MSKLSKFAIGDNARVTQSMHAAFDEVGVIVAHVKPRQWMVHDRPEVLIQFPNGHKPLPTQERHLTLADPDVHTVLDQMDAESAPEPNRRAQVLRTAESLVNGQRADDYGPPAENFGRVAAMWSAQFAAKLKEPLTADEVAIGLVHLKLSRLANTPDHADSFIDAAEYIALAAEIAEAAQ